MAKKNRKKDELSSTEKADPRDLEKLDIQYVPVDAIKPNVYNPNRQSEHEFELLCRSIEEDGFTQPILVQKDTLTIVDGEHRWRAMKALGYTEVPVCFTHMGPAEAKIATLRHNRARGNEDIQRAADVFRDLKNMGADEWAKDSLMLSDIETSMMTEMIPTAQLHLRSDNMSFSQVQDTLEKEEMLEKVKKQEDEMMAKKDLKRYTLQLTFLADEAYIVRAVLGTEHAQGVIRLCHRVVEQGLITV